MSLEERLAGELIAEHPERAAAVLERLAPEAAAKVLGHGPAQRAAGLLGRLSPPSAEAALARLEVQRVAELLKALPPGDALRLLRCVESARFEEVLGGLPEDEAAALRTSLRFPEHSAGALMDPRVLALPEDFSAKEALERVRSVPERAHYNLYVIDAGQKLVGALNLRELFVARPTDRLRDLMVGSPQALDATTDRAGVVAHPGWRSVHSLPVVDEEHRYLGAIRYRTLRDLEEQLLRGRRRDAQTPRALGQLFAAGAGGLLDALVGAAATTGEED